MSNVPISDHIGNLDETAGFLSTDKLILYTRLPCTAPHSHLCAITMETIMKVLDARYARKGTCTAKAKDEVQPNPISAGAKNVNGRIYQRIKESKRVYNLGADEWYIIYAPEWLHVHCHEGLDCYGSEDSHYVIDGAGVTHYIPHGWLSVRWH